MKALSNMLLFVLVLTAGAFAGDRNNDNFSPNWGHKWRKPAPPVELTGVSQYVAWVAGTGQMVSAPDANFCEISEARLTFGPGSHTSLYTKEECMGGAFIRELNWDVIFRQDGKLAMILPDAADSMDIMAEHTGCPVHNGTMPVYYGFFDGNLFHATGEFHGVCTGGTMWGPIFGVSEALGPLHVNFLISLEAVD